MPVQIDFISIPSYINISTSGLYSYCMRKERESNNPSWTTIERPGYSGKRKDELIQHWNSEYGENNWRLTWELANGEVMDYENVFWKIYVPGYVRHFGEHPDEVELLTQNYSYAYDKDLITRKEAFDPYALYNKPEKPNQFHNVSLNIAIEWYLGIPFQGRDPVKVREGKPGTDVSTWPEGWKWSPGRVNTVRLELIPQPHIEGWWKPDTIEDIYQSSKALQIKTNL